MEEIAKWKHTVRKAAFDHCYMTIREGVVVNNSDVWWMKPLKCSANHTNIILMILSLTGLGSRLGTEWTHEDLGFGQQLFRQSAMASDFEMHAQRKSKIKSDKMIWHIKVIYNNNHWLLSLESCGFHWIYHIGWNLRVLRGHRGLVLSCHKVEENHRQPESTVHVCVAHSLPVTQQ